MRGSLFRKVGGTLGLLGIVCLVLSGAAQASLLSAAAKTNATSDLVQALQEICATSGLWHEGGEGPASPHKPASAACTLCCTFGHTPLGLGPIVLGLLPAFAPVAFLPLKTDRQAGTLSPNLPPSRAPPLSRAF